MLRWYIPNHSLGFNARWEVILIIEEIFDFVRLDVKQNTSSIESSFLFTSVGEISTKDIYVIQNLHREKVHTIIN